MTKIRLSQMRDTAKCLEWYANYQGIRFEDSSTEFDDRKPCIETVYDLFKRYPAGHSIKDGRKLELVDKGYQKIEMARQEQRGFEALIAFHDDMIMLGGK